MPSRLSTVAADLAEQLEHRPSSQLRKVATIAALLAVDRTHLADPRLDAALTAIRDGAAGDRNECSAVSLVVEELDEKAWDIQESVDEGTQPQEAYLEAFRMARAAESIGFALEVNPLQAALEAVYEAQAAVSDLEAIRTAISPALAD
jgi:hypothetical protein